MIEIFKTLTEHGFFLEEPGNDKLIALIEKEYSIELPSDYKEFMLLTNGGEGNLPGSYISIWKLEDLVRLNAEYKIRDYLNNYYIGFGTDGGDECWAFNYDSKAAQPKVVKVPLGDLDLNSVDYTSSSFEKFIKNVLEIAI